MVYLIYRYKAADVCRNIENNDPPVVTMGKCNVVL